MKITKVLRAFLILLSFLMVLPLFACGDSPEDTTTKAPEVTTAPQETTDEKTEATTDESKASDTAAKPEYTDTTESSAVDSTAETVTSASTEGETTESGSETTESCSENCSESDSEPSETVGVETTETPDKETSNETTEPSACEHKEEAMEAVAPTCENTGLTEGKKCADCGEVLVPQETVAALGHDWDEGKITVEPTCEAEGERTVTCTRQGCGATKTEKVDPIGHAYEGVVATEPTCTKEGVMTYTCKNDSGHTYTEPIPTADHTWADATLDTPKTCTVCGATEGGCLEIAQDNVFTAADLLAAYKANPTDAFKGEVVEENGVAFFRATATAAREGVLVLNSGKNTVEGAGKSFVIVYRSNAPKLTRFSLRVNAAGKTDNSGGFTAFCDMTGTSEWSVVYFASSSALDLSKGAGFVSIDIFDDDGNTNTAIGDVVEIALIAAVDSEDAAKNTVGEYFGKIIAFPYTSYFNGVEINGTAITDAKVIPEKKATDKPVKMDLSGVVIGGNADSCLKLGAGWSVTRGGWDYFECKITSADGNSSTVRISEGVDLAETSNTLATLRTQYPTYGNDLGKGGNLMSPVLIDLSGYEGKTVALEVYGISNFGMSYKIAELINVYVPGLDNVFIAYDFAAAYKNAPNSAYTAEVLSEDGVTFFRATATKDGNGRLTLNNGERAIEPFGKTFILVYRGKSTNSGQKFQTYLNVAGKTDASGGTVPAATKENTDEWKVVIFQTASTLDFSAGAGFVAIDLFFNNGLSGDYIDIALFASVADEAEAWATFEEKLGDKIKLPYRAYVNNASVNGTAYSDGTVFTGGNNGNNTPVIIDLANVSIAEDSDLAGCIKLGASWAITRGGWDYYICNIVAESGKTKSVRFYEGADYPSGSSTLAALKNGFEATYGSDLAVGGNIVVPAFDLSGFEGERVTVELVGISNYGAAYTVAKVINAQLPGIAEYDKVENFVSFVDYTKESVRKTVDIKDGTEYGASFTVPSGELVKTVRVNLTNSNSLNACSVNVSVYSFTGSYAASVAGTPICSKTYTEVIKCADIEAELFEGDYLVVVKYVFAEGGVASSVVTDNAWSANTLPDDYSDYNILNYKNGSVSTSEAIFGGILVETVGASAPEDDVIDATFSDTTAKVIVIAGQSNAAGVSMNSYLQSSVDAEDYSKYVNGFPNVKIFFTCGSGSAGINYNNVVEEFVEVKLGQGFVDRSFGPELALAEYLADNYPDEQFYIIKYAIGGTAMHKQWNALSADKRQCVDELEAKIDKGLELLENAGLTPEILAFFWMQGEGDALTAKLTEPYYDYQKALMTELREKYSDYSSYGEIPFIDTEINDEGFWAASHMINDAKCEIARESSRNYIIDPNYCGLTAFYENDDLAHYDSTSMLLLGKLYAMKLDYIYALSSK